MFSLFPEKVHKGFYIGALILLAVSLPFSVFTLSVAQITLIVNWVLEGKHCEKWAIIKRTPSLWMLGIFYLVPLIGMTYTSNYDWGFHELKINLPLLALPLVIATSAPLSKKLLTLVLNFFVWAVLLFSLYSGYLIFGFDGKPTHTMLELSPIIWHIRWILMAVMAIFIIIWLFINEVRWWIKWHYIAAFTWLIVYLFLFQSLTGIVVFIVTSIILLTWFTFRQKQFMAKWFTLVLLLTMVLITVSYLTNAYARFYTIEKVDFSKLETHSAAGNPYWHDTTKRYIENGHYINLYICIPELEGSWQKRSRLDFNGKAKDGGDLKFVLVRYLTSKGLRKDAEGMNKLTDREIRYIEMGKTNYIDTFKYALYPRIYTSMWELYQYKMGANPTGYSLSQRIEYLKTAFHIIRKNVWFGVGTGDVENSFADQYIIDKSPLAKDSQWWANNQFVSFVVYYGIIGFVLIMISLLIPPFIEKKYSDYLFLTILIVGFLSFLDEDTFETHPGISMFAFFYSLFLFYKKDEKA